MSDINVCQLAYFAGLFDGEGTVGVYATSNGKNDKVYWSAKVAVTCTYRPAVEDFSRVFQVGQLSSDKRTKNHLGAKPLWRWQITNKADIAYFLSSVLPFLREKREQAEIVIAYCGGRIDGEEVANKLKHIKSIVFPHDIGEGERRVFGNNSEDGSCARTTYSVAEEIRARVRAGEKQCSLVKEYGFSQSMVSKIIMNKTYTKPPRTIRRFDA